MQATLFDACNIVAMKLHERNLLALAASGHCVDRQGFLYMRPGGMGGSCEPSRLMQRRWLVLHGNLLFYFERRQDREPLGVIVLEDCCVELSCPDGAAVTATEHCFHIRYAAGEMGRSCQLRADTHELMEAWIRSLSTASHTYMRLLVCELRRQVTELTAATNTMPAQRARGPARLNPFHRSVAPLCADATATFATLHEELGRVIRYDRDNWRVDRRRDVPLGNLIQL